MAFESTGENDVRMDIGVMLAAVLRRWFRILLVTALLCGLTYALLLFVPRTYEATASILVEPRQNAFTDPVTARDVPAIPTESTISSQIELIKSRDTLRMVIDAFELRNVAEFNGSETESPIDSFMRLIGRGPSDRSVEETVMQNLLERLSVVRERDSAVINVSVRSVDPELAARLANGIAQAHVDRRAGLTVSDTTGASIWLEAEIAKMRKRVEEAEARVADFRVQNDMFTGANNTSLLDQQLSEISAQITAAQERRNAAETRAALIDRMIAAGQSLDGVPAVRESQVIQQLSQTKANLQAERAQKLATLLQNHPTIQALNAQIRELDQQIVLEGRRVADAARAEANIEADLVTSLQGELERAKVSASGATRNSVALDSLEREAKAQRDLLNTYLARYTEASSRSEGSASLPDVRVITAAGVPNSPASPKTGMILFAVGFVSIVLQIGAVLFGELMSGRALYETPRPVRMAEQDADMGDDATATEAQPADESVSARPTAEALAEDEAIAAYADDETLDLFAEPDVVPAMAYPEPQPRPAAPPAPPAPVAAAPVPSAPELPAPVVPAAPVAPAAIRPEPAREAMVAAQTEPKTEPKAEPRVEAKPEPTREYRPVPRPEPKPEAWIETRAEARPAPRAMPQEPAAPQRPAADRYGVDPAALSNLSADLALGRIRVVALAGLDGHGDAEVTATRLIDEQLKRGLSVALVDAGSATPSVEPGVTDLAAGEASFGDVVFKSQRDGLAEVPWGHGDSLDLTSGKPLTLVEALTDIYEVVIVLVGEARASTLSCFAGLDCRVVLATAVDPDHDAVEPFCTQVLALGFAYPQVVLTPSHRAAVA